MVLGRGSSVLKLLKLALQATYLLVLLSNALLTFKIVFPQRFERSLPFPQHLVEIARAPPPFPHRSAAVGHIGPLNPGKPYQVVGFSALAAGRGICS